jgi:L-alanine-DL-glutamate epimerase-like enolase superfamily enzyme
MKIADVRAVQPPTPGAPQDWRTQLGQIVVEVRTDDGCCGIGVGGGGAAGIHVVRTVLRDLLLGREAASVEALHDAMCRHTAFYGRKGLVVMAISGVDLALWDLRGKAAGMPVARLLNPGVDLGRPLDTYGTVWNDAEIPQAIAAGHRAVKLHVESHGRSVDVGDVVERVRRARQSIGPQPMLMVDAFAHWDVASTLAIAEAVAPFDVAWLEEPLPPDDEDGYAELAARSSVPIAGGEHEYLSVGFRPLIERRLHAVLQPDVNWCGGMTTLVDLYRLAQRAGLRVCPHRGSEAFALHAIAALDDRPLAESGRKWFTCLRGAPAIENGRIRVGDAPGFGVTVDESIW